MRQEESERIRLKALESFVGARIRQEREARGWTLDRLSEAMSAEGRPMATGRLSKIERGLYESPLSFRDLDAAAASLGVAPVALLVTAEEAALLAGLRKSGLPGVMHWTAQAMLNK